MKKPNRAERVKMWEGQTDAEILGWIEDETGIPTRGWAEHELFPPYWSDSDVRLIVSSAIRASGKP